MSDIIKASREGAVASVTIDRAADGNLLDTDMLRALNAALLEAAASDAKVLLLRSTGADFCRGRDPRGGPAVPTALALRNSLQPILDIYDTLASARQPVVCVVQGIANGFGCAMAGACDITIAADVARFRLSEMEKDLPPTLAISALMPRVPRKALTYMVYAMPWIDAATALQLGIVSQVVPLAELDRAVAALLEALSARSAAALIAVKDYFRSAPLMEPRGAAAYGGTLLGAVLSSAGPSS